MNRTPRTTRMLNAVLAPVVKGQADPEGTWAKAAAQIEKKHGSADRSFADELSQIVAGAAQISRISPLGWALILAEVKGRYVNKLRINRVRAEHPEVADEPIVTPVVVCGLPRTATTLTHRVLSASPHHRAPLMWELAHTDLEDPRAAARVAKQIQRGADMMQRLAPAIRHIHPIHADRPEESMPVHGSHWEALHGLMPGYRAWVTNHDMTHDYEDLKLGLQVLQHGRQPKRWVLKYPAYLGDMDKIRSVFPDATFVWTHRDPVSVIGSSCSLVETFWGLYQYDVDRQEIGQFVLDHLVGQVQRGLELRRSLPPASIIDVPYHQLSANPVAEVPRLYAAIGAAWTTDDEKHLVEVIAKPKGTPSHQYDPARYLDLDEVNEAFAPYNKLLDHLSSARDTTPVVEL